MKNIWLILVLTIATSNSVLAQARPFNFDHTLKAFKLAIASSDQKAVANMVRFPLPTSVSPAGLLEGKPSDLLSRSDFERYYSDIFHPDLVGLLAKAKSAAISVVNSSDGKYYSALQKSTDKGSTMYELYVQYQQSSANSESYFGLVFGKVSGKYKLIAYYTKWSVK